MPKPKTTGVHISRIPDLEVQTAFDQVRQKLNDITTTQATLNKVIGKVFTLNITNPSPGTPYSITDPALNVSITSKGGLIQLGLRQGIDQVQTVPTPDPFFAFSNAIGRPAYLTFTIKRNLSVIASFSLGDTGNASTTVCHFNPNQILAQDFIAAGLYNYNVSLSFSGDGAGLQNMQLYAVELL